ncbi:hypothetical protein N9Y67_03845, partial [Pseudomonadota bacterium]|nr:hypothetical protein [Pseudomonadota bacterium]
DVNNVTYERLMKRGFVPQKNLFPLRNFLSFLTEQIKSEEMDNRKLTLLLSSVCDVITKPGGDKFGQIEKERLKTVFTSGVERLPLYLAISSGSNSEYRNRILKAYLALKADSSLYDSCLSGHQEQEVKTKCEVVKP